MQFQSGHEGIFEDVSLFAGVRLTVVGDRVVPRMRSVPGGDKVPFFCGQAGVETVVVDFQMGLGVGGVDQRIGKFFRDRVANDIVFNDGT